tara:strand:+ start:871 stop:1185 length:315 start_codon:yes stop_codon:yes gene_type:complete
MGDCLVVGIDSDDKVKRDKGPSRPHNCSEDRKFALQCIRHVDEVVVFSTREELEKEIEKRKPDLMVIGSDWEGKEVVGQRHAKELQFFERIGNYSTTRTLNKSS